ncbi:MAG: rod shape-determining protein RodA [SAR324 cluster bacterium]|uniref:Peptidoglycan glycosyltransferase RodA n=1 Tax=SAR324 cluster bacterium TaxID=2024889 RepID=A0A7X9FRD7_9DELT|nr:rod shape-determining protein RodA [SAR324 cluster bacterium]
MPIDRRLFSHFDWPLFGLALLIPLSGLLVLYSAGYDPDKTISVISWMSLELHSEDFAKQLLFIGISLIALILALAIPPSVVQKYAYLFYIVCMVLLLLVAEFGIVVNGSRRWLSLGRVNLQASEVVKLGIIFAFARFLSRHPPPREGYGFISLLFPSFLLLLPMGLIMLQPDLGSAIVVGSVGACMLLFMGVRLRVLIPLVVIAVFAIIPAYSYVLHDYQKRRIEVLFNPDADPKGSGYHITQSKIAVGSGKLLGKGFLNGTQTQLQFLPEHTTDFVFSVLAEEWGFVGCISVLMLYMLLLTRLLQLAQRTRDLFSCLLIFGVASRIFCNVVINVSMVVGLLPVVGIPLPLFSYGGSSIVSLMFSIGIVLGIGMRRFAYMRS